MPRSPTRKSGRLSTQRLAVARAMLLPLMEANVRTLSLPLHLALATCRSERAGNAHHVNELLRALYVTFYLQEQGLGAMPLSVFTRAEAAVNAALARVNQTKLWIIDEDTALLFEQVLRAGYAAHQSIVARLDVGDRAAEALHSCTPRVSPV